MTAREHYLYLARRAIEQARFWTRSEASLVPIDERRRMSATYLAEAARNRRLAASTRRAPAPAALPARFGRSASYERDLIASGRGSLLGDLW
jgi:hypothetical protein